ncbi:uncharacterized protein LOC108148232 isoform X2 [Drosophila elegans]|uniref:uncharacterized protein LOC108148232 isoform X2 n=1 Tax=Drosophila elegans TaxID=30023 RepID=UPI001BC83D3E|nr:uncharacterized protein LOC108148232 isoform X2 [Drosophila elegans]
MGRVLLLQCVILGSSVLALSHMGNETSFETSPLQWSPRSLGRIIAHCLGGLEVWECLGSESERLLDGATKDNSTWQISDYLSIEPLDGLNNQERRRMNTGLPGKLMELVQGRALRFQLPRQLTISNAIDDFGSELGLDQGRKKKDKDKHMAMMGGMIMMATLAQMFLGKVILIAGSAFIMAKIALVISLLSKKGFDWPQW